MNREQARGIVKNIDLIRHYANGGDIGHRLIDCKGKELYIQPAHSIVMSNFHPDRHCLYVRLKPRLVLSGGVMVRRQRNFTERIKPAEIIDDASAHAVKEDA